MRFRQTLTFTLEYETNPELYCPGASEKKMLEIDKEILEDDIWFLIDNPDTKTEITVEKIV